MKMIQTEDKVWQKLTIIKAEMMKTSLNDVIEELLKYYKNRKIR